MPHMLSHNFINLFVKKVIARQHKKLHIIQVGYEQESAASSAPVVALAILSHAERLQDAWPCSLS